MTEGCPGANSKDLATILDSKKLDSGRSAFHDVVLLAARLVRFLATIAADLSRLGCDSRLRLWA